MIESTNVFLEIITTNVHHLLADDVKDGDQERDRDRDDWVVTANEEIKRDFESIDVVRIVEQDKNRLLLHESGLIVIKREREKERRKREMDFFTVVLWLISDQDDDEPSSRLGLVVRLLLTADHRPRLSRNILALLLSIQLK